MSDLDDINTEIEPSAGVPELWPAVPLQEFHLASPSGMRGRS